MGDRYIHRRFRSCCRYYSVMIDLWFYLVYKNVVMISFLREEISTKKKKKLSDIVKISIDVPILPFSSHAYRLLPTYGLSSSSCYTGVACYYLCVTSTRL